MDRIAVILAVLTLLASQHALAAQAPADTVVIEGPSGSIELAPPDADAFQRRLNRPPDFEEPPVSSGGSFSVVSEYWAQAVPVEEDGGVVDERAEYFPDGGLARTVVDGVDVWLVLDLRQQAILDRYVEYGEATGWSDERPGSLTLASFAARSEAVGVELGSVRLATAESQSLLVALADAGAAVRFLEPAEPPDAGGDGYWVSLSLIEGRTLRYFLEPENGTLTGSFGRERYDVASLIGTVLPSEAPAGVVEQEAPAGSDLWWIATLGGGAAFLLLAVFARKRKSERE